MKCISLWQPWASLLAHGRKRVETRGWALRHRGPLLIHAARKWSGELDRLCAREPFKDALNSFLKNGPGDLPLGAIVGCVDVVACYPTELVAVTAESRSAVEPYQDEQHGTLEISDTEMAFGDYMLNRFAWLCRNFIPFRTPVQFRGAQGLFDVPDHMVPEAVNVTR